MRWPEYGRPYQESTYGAAHQSAYLRRRSERLTTLLKTLGTGGARNVLEVGCGNGLSLAHLGRASNHHLIGVDTSRKMLRTATQNVRTAGRALYLAQASATSLPFADASFDFVYATRFIHLFRDKKSVIDELIRVTRPGGTVVVEFYTRPYHVLAWLMQRGGRQFDEYLSHYPPRSEVRALVGPHSQYIPLRLAGERVLHTVLGDSTITRLLDYVWHTPLWPAVAEYFAVFMTQGRGM